MSRSSSIQVVVDGRRGELILNRPERHNALDEAMIAELTVALRELAADPGVRVVVLSAVGKSFCSGADLAWMQRAAGYGEEENLADARNLATLYATLDTLAKPTLARVQGPAYGGGVGLVAACDMAIGVSEARFALTEVRLGLIPAVISPYVLAAIGPRQARRYMLSAEVFPAVEALRLGLLHQVAEDLAALDRTVDSLVKTLAANGPEALSSCKQLISEVAGRPIDPPLIEDTARRITAVRAGAEAAEGLSAFLEKRRPTWQGGQGNVC